MNSILSGAVSAHSAGAPRATLRQVVLTMLTGLVATGWTFAGRVVFAERIVSPERSFATAVVAADLDGDGDMDLISTAEGAIPVAWHENDGGSKNPRFTFHGINGSLRTARWVSTGDLDGDGDMDVLAASEGDHAAAWYENLGGKPLSFEERILTRTAGFAKVAIPGDMDGDGRLDIVVGSEIDDKIAWYRNEGGSPVAFTEHVITEDPDGLGSMDGFAGGLWEAAVVDLDGDGDLDIVFVGDDENRLGWFENDGVVMPSFAGRDISSFPNVDLGVRSLETADLDGDGDLDVLVGTATLGMVQLYLNNGSQPPTFTELEAWRAGGTSRSLASGDLDGEGLIDVVATLGAARRIEWHENSGGTQPAFTTHVVGERLVFPLWVSVADVDGDGDLDVLSASSGDSTIRWFENLVVLPHSSGGKP